MRNSEVPSHTRLKLRRGSGAQSKERVVDMSEVLNKAVAALLEKLSGTDFGSTAKFVIEGEGAVTVDGGQTPPAVAAEDGDAAVTITATQDTFEEMMSGELDATSAYMSGRIRIEGDMGVAMQLAQALA